MKTDTMDAGTLERAGPSAGDRARHGSLPADDMTWPMRCTHTRWSVVLAAGAGGDSARAALGKLYRAYWYPVFAYIAVRRGRDAARELTQDFFVDRLVGSQDLKRVRRTPGGLFRSWLFKAVESFLKNQWKFERQQCRDVRKTVTLCADDDVARPSSLAELRDAAGRAAHPDQPDSDTANPKRLRRAKICSLGDLPRDPEQQLTREGAYGLLADVLGRLRRDYCKHAADAGVDGEQRFDAVKAFLPGRDTESPHFKIPAEALDMNPEAVKQLVDRLKRRFTDLLDEELRLNVVDSETDLETARRLLVEALEAPASRCEGV